MKYIYPPLLVILMLAIGFLYYLQFSSSDLVYVDSSSVLNQYQGMLDARRTYQGKTNTWKANIDTLASEVQRSIKKYEKEVTVMSEKERKLSQELIRSKQKQLADFQRAINEKAAQEDAEMTARVIKQVNAYLKKYGEKHNYKIIFAATEYGNIAYAKDGIDVTEEIINGLNEEYYGK